MISATPLRYSRMIMLPRVCAVASCSSAEYVSIDIALLIRSLAVLGRAQEPLALAGSLLRRRSRRFGPSRRRGPRPGSRAARRTRSSRQAADSGHIDALDRDTKTRSSRPALKPVVHGGQQRLTNLAAQHGHRLCAVVGVLLVAGLDEELVEPAARRHAHRRGSEERSAPVRHGSLRARRRRDP